MGCMASMFGTNCNYVVNGSLINLLMTLYMPLCWTWYTYVVMEVYPVTYMVVRHWLPFNGEVLGQPVGTCIMVTCTLK